jgi:hypothetical protein
MAYCPNCLTKYTEGFTDCDDCHVPLVAGAPPDAAEGEKSPGFEPGAEIVGIRTFSGPTASLNGELAQNILQTQGINCALPGEGHAEMLPGIDMVQLWVLKEDAERAEEILKSYLDSPEAYASGGDPDSDDEEPEPDEEEPEPDEEDPESEGETEP